MHRVMHPLVSRGYESMQCLIHQIMPRSTHCTLNLHTSPCNTRVDAPRCTRLPVPLYSSSPILNRCLVLCNTRTINLHTKKYIRLLYLMHPLVCARMRATSARPRGDHRCHYNYLWVYMCYMDECINCCVYTCPAVGKGDISEHRGQSRDYVGSDTVCPRSLSQSSVALPVPRGNQKVNIPYSRGIILIGQTVVWRPAPATRDSGNQEGKICADKHDKNRIKKRLVRCIKRSEYIMHSCWQEMKTAKGRRKILKQFGIKIIAEESDYWRVTGDKQEMGNVASLYAIEFNYDSDRCKPGVWIMTWNLSGVKMCGAPDLSWKCWVED